MPLIPSPSCTAPDALNIYFDAEITEAPAELASEMGAAGVDTSIIESGVVLWPEGRSNKTDAAQRLGKDLLPLDPLRTSPLTPLISLISLKDAVQRLGNKVPCEKGCWCWCW